VELAPPAPDAAVAPENLAGARDHRGRLAFETRLAEESTAESREAALSSIAKSGDTGSVEALRILLAAQPPPPKEFLRRVGEAAQSMKIEAAVAGMVRERLSGLGRCPGAAGLDEDEDLLSLLGELDAGAPSTRSLLLAYATLGTDTESALARAALGPEIAAVLGPSGERTSIARWLTALDRSVVGSPSKPRDDLREAAVLETELARLDEALAGRPGDPALLAEYGQATLALARRRMESGGSGAQLLLQDADHFLEQASHGQSEGAQQAALLISRARANYLLGRFEEQEKIAQAAAAAARGEERIEALRWLGDASARLLGARSGGDAAVEAQGIRRGADALLAVCESKGSDETDWISLGSFLGALGLRREELAVYQPGAERLPASAALRSALNAALWAGGRIDLAAPKAEWIAARHSDSAECAWHAGYARMLEAEEQRRGERPDLAIESYGKADRWFLACAALKPEFQDSADHYRAMCALGRGFAELLADRRDAAAHYLVEGLAIRPASATARDGLDREAVDLLDGSLEWRAEGPSPVDVTAFLADLERADPGNSFWPRSISDSELREALRAEGRGDAAEGERYLRLSIDAGRRALAISDDAESRRALAQALTIHAERLLERGDFEEARKFLAEAAPLLGEEPPAAALDAQGLGELAARLREKLGAARPRFRPGR
jgi:hypothetical protein